MKYAWIIFFVYGLLTVMTVPIHLLGRPPDPPSPEGMTGLTLDQIGVQIPGMLDYISSISVQLGNFLLGLGVLIMAIAATPYEKGEKKSGPGLPSGSFQLPSSSNWQTARVDLPGNSTWFS